MPGFAGGGVFDPTRDYTISGTTSFQAPFGYGPISQGIGSKVTQLTNRTTAVTINALSGTITTNSASLAAENSASFTVNNSNVLIGDVVVCAQQSGSNGGNTDVVVTAVAAGSFTLMVANNNASGGTAETGAILINFAIVRAVSS